MLDEQEILERKREKNSSSHFLSSVPRFFHVTWAFNNIFTEKLMWDLLTFEFKENILILTGFLFWFDYRWRESLFFFHSFFFALIKFSFQKGISGFRVCAFICTSLSKKVQGRYLKFLYVVEWISKKHQRNFVELYIGDFMPKSVN